MNNYQDVIDEYNKREVVPLIAKVEMVALQSSYFSERDKADIVAMLRIDLGMGRATTQDEESGCQALLNEINNVQIECEEDLAKIKGILDREGIDYELHVDSAFDSPGLEVYYYALSFEREGQIALTSGTFEYD